MDKVNGSENSGLLDAVLSLARDADVHVDGSKQPRGVSNEASWRKVSEDEIAAAVLDASRTPRASSLTDSTARITWDHQSFAPALTTRASSPSTALRFESRMPFGAWLDPLHYIRLSEAPDDIRPYLGAGADTFAGRLFWWGMEHSNKDSIGCKRQTHHHPNPAAVIQHCSRHSEATRALPPQFILAMVAARLEYLHTGSISPERATAGEPDLAGAMTAGIEAEYRARGKDLAQWLSCMGMERYLRALLGEAAFAMLERAEHGKGETRLIELWEECKCRLYVMGVCFGDGPRWHVQTINNLFLWWMSEALDSRQVG